MQPKKIPKVFVIILNYNGKEDIKACLSSVFSSDYPNLEIVLADNDSTDGSFELAKNLFSKAHFIKNRRNLGFSAGNNIGIRFALEKMADYVMLLNNDAALEKNSISVLVSEAEKIKDAGILGPVMLKGNLKEIWFAGGRIDWLRMRTSHLLEIPKKTSKTDYICGCAMLIKKEVFREIGLLDEKFFIYYEDADFCLRGNQRGFKSYVVPDAKIRHFEKSGQNNPLKTYWLVTSGIIFFKKNFRGFRKLWIDFYLVIRRAKNYIDTILNQNLSAKEVRRAYKESKKWETKKNYLS